MPPVPTPPVRLLLSRLAKVKASAEGWTALCPSHEDTARSLSVGIGRDGRALVRCFTGCSVENVLGSVGLSTSDLFMPREESYGALALKPAPRPVESKPVESPDKDRDNRKRWPIVKTWDYVDADGEFVFRVCRREEPRPTGKKPRKDFFQQHKGASGWITGLAGVEQRPLYRLPEVLEDIAAERTLLLVEGEKACDAARALGYPAVAHMGGANGWRDEYAQQLAGATIVILPDNDDPGRTWAVDAAASLIAAGCTVKMLALPVIDEKDDIVEWIDRGGDAKQLARLLERAVPWSVGDPVPLPPGLSKFKLLSVADLEGLPPLDWLIGEEMAGIFPAASLLAMFGPPGGGKSFLAADLSCTIGNKLGLTASLDAVTPLWFGNAVRHGPVVYVLAEGGRGFRSRILTWRTAKNIPADKLALSFVLEPVNLYAPDDVSHILRAADLLTEPPALFVFDTLARSMVGADENSAQDVGMAIDRAGCLTRETGASVLLVHHTRKDDDGERGSSALRGGVDTLCSVRVSEEGGHVLTCEKQKDGAAFPPINFYLTPTGESCVVSDQPPVGPKALTQNQLAALKALSDLFPKGASSSEWYKASGIAERTFYRIRAWLVTEGYVSEFEQRGYLRYAVTQSGRWAVNGVIT